jgi:catechol 2,3-dioxygenase-like lactoylglutathione lyase family enzyme
MSRMNFCANIYNSTRSVKIMKFNKLVPEMSVSDYEKSLTFYTKILGFKIEYQRKNFSFLSFEGSQIMIEKVNNTWKTADLEYPFGRGMNLQIEVEDIQQILASLKKHNYFLFRVPSENWYEKDNILLGNREFLVQDPDGYLLRFAQDIGVKKKNQHSL